MGHRGFRSNDQGENHKGKTQPYSFSIIIQLFNRDIEYNERSREWVSSPKYEQVVAWRSLVASRYANIELTFP